jgi:hypothetical protein
VDRPSDDLHSYFYIREGMSISSYEGLPVLVISPYALLAYASFAGADYRECFYILTSTSGRV